MRFKFKKNNLLICKWKSLMNTKSLFEGALLKNFKPSLCIFEYLFNSSSINML